MLDKGKRRFSTERPMGKRASTSPASKYMSGANAAMGPARRDELGSTLRLYMSSPAGRSCTGQEHGTLPTTISPRPTPFPHDRPRLDMSEACPGPGARRSLCEMRLASSRASKSSVKFQVPSQDYGHNATASASRLASSLYTNVRGFIRKCTDRPSADPVAMPTPANNHALTARRPSSPTIIRAFLQVGGRARSKSAQSVCLEQVAPHPICTPDRKIRATCHGDVADSTGHTSPRLKRPSPATATGG